MDGSEVCCIQSICQKGTGQSRLGTQPRDEEVSRVGGKIKLFEGILEDVGKKGGASAGKEGSQNG